MTYHVTPEPWMVATDAFALAHNEQWGIWASTTPRDRQRLARRAA